MRWNWNFFVFFFFRWFSIWFLFVCFPLKRNTSIFCNFFPFCYVLHLDRYLHTARFIRRKYFQIIFFFFSFCSSTLESGVDKESREYFFLYCAPANRTVLFFSDNIFFSRLSESTESVQTVLCFSSAILLLTEFEMIFSVLCVCVSFLLQHNLLATNMDIDDFYIFYFHSKNLFVFRFYSKFFFFLLDFSTHYRMYTNKN